MEKTALKVTLFAPLLQQIWACNLCKKKQELLVKTGQWYHGGMAKPVALDVDTGSDASSVRTEASPPHEKKSKFPDQGSYSQDSGQGSEKENIVQNVPPGKDGRPAVQRTGSLRRQYSMTIASESGLGKIQSPGSDRGTMITRGVEEDQQQHRRHERGGPRPGNRDGHTPDGMPSRQEGQPPSHGDRDRDRDRDRHGPGEGGSYHHDRDRRHPPSQHGDKVSPPGGHRDRDNMHDPRLRGNLTPDGRNPPHDISSSHPGGDRGRDRLPSRERYGRDGERRRDESRHRYVPVSFLSERAP